MTEYVWLASVLLCSYVSGVHITKLGGPNVIQSGQELIIDCDFEYLPDEESQLDLKWYFNGSPIPVYQWVPSMNKGPQVIGDLFKENLDLNYQAHNDTFKKHRALRIVNPDHRFSGSYQCKVSSFVDEDFMMKEVLVYAPPKNIVIEPLISESDSRYLDISCKVKSVYPVPLIDISLTNNSTSAAMVKTDTLVITSPEGLLDVTVSCQGLRKDITPDVVMACEVTIKNTEFYVREEIEMFEYPILKSRYTSGTSQISTACILSILTVLIRSQIV